MTDDDEPDVQPIDAWSHFLDELWFAFKRSGWLVLLFVYVVVVALGLFGWLS